MKGSWRVIDECVNQDTGKRHKKGDIINELSPVEYGRLSAFGYIEEKARTEKKKQGGVKSINAPKKTAIQKGPWEKRG